MGQAGNGRHRHFATDTLHRTPTTAINSRNHGREPAKSYFAAREFWSIDAGLTRLPWRAPAASVASACGKTRPAGTNIEALNWLETT